MTYSNEWIEWNGGLNPFGDGSDIVEVMFHDETTAINEAGAFNWHYNPARANIIKYRPRDVASKEATLREAIQFAIGELDEAADKFWVSHCNHPGDRFIENKDSLSALHARQDKAILERLCDRMTTSKKTLKILMVDLK